MATTMEKSKKAKNNQDRLSDLPDCILLHILSFLPEIRFCVRTTLLSKRWNNLWASLPDIIFHRHESPNAQSFEKLVSNVLNVRENLPVNKLTFTFKYQEQDKSLITTIIKYAMYHNVQHFSITAKSSLAYLTPLFNISASLKTLNLESFDNMGLLENFTLPSLTALSLSWCTFGGSGEGDPISIDPFVGLFNLKSLKLMGCSSSTRRFEIRGPLVAISRVRKLKISGLQLDSLTISGLYDYKVEIFASKLRCFSASRVHLLKFSHLPLLEIAEINVFLPFTGLNEAFVKSLLDLISMFRGLYNAHSLMLPSHIIRGLMEYPHVLEDQSSPFVRLTTLKVECPPHLMCSLNIPDNVIKYFGENITVEKIIG